MSLPPPTKEEECWMQDICRIGCLVCYVFHKAPGTPAVPHHMIDGGRRMGHKFTLALCDPGHHQYGAPLKLSRHPDRARFERKYGTEAELYEMQVMLVNRMRECTA